jgi:hypothetical protein
MPAHISSLDPNEKARGSRAASSLLQSSLVNLFFTLISLAVFTRKPVFYPHRILENQKCN